jgi:hypothetical protein
MAAPATTTRGTPAGARIDDGFRTLIAFALDPTVSFWEKTTKPPGLDGRDPVDTTTQWNSTYTTKNPRKLIDIMPLTVKAAYDPNIYVRALALLNRKGSITIRFPDNSTLDFFGFLQKIEFDDLQEGTQPECTLTIVVTNQDPTTGAEQAPVLTNVTGT